MMWNNGGNFFEGGFPMMMGGLMMIVFWGVIIWLLFHTFGKSSPNGKVNNSPDAVELLRQRYSRGEINAEEYRERLKELKDTAKKN